MSIILISCELETAILPKIAYLEHDDSLYYFNNFKLDNIKIISNYIKKKNKKLNNLIRYNIAKEILIKSEKHNIPESLILGIIEVESNFNPFAISHKNSRGLMQIFDKKINGRKIDINKIYDIGYNIECGILILKSKIRVSNRPELRRILYLYGCREHSDKVFRSMGEYIFFSNRFMETQQRQN